MRHTVSQYSESLKANVCLCVTVYNVLVQLLVCMSLCLRDCLCILSYNYYVCIDSTCISVWLCLLSIVRLRCTDLWSVVVLRLLKWIKEEEENENRKRKQPTHHCCPSIPSTNPPSTNHPMNRTSKQPNQLSKHQALTSWPKTKRTKGPTQRT